LEQADRETQPRLPAGFGFSSRALAEAFGRFVVSPQLLKTDGEIEIAGRVFRLQAQQSRVALGSIVVLFQFKLDVTDGGVYFRAVAATRNCALEFLQRFFAFSFKVK